MMNKFFLTLCVGFMVTLQHRIYRMAQHDIIRQTPDRCRWGPPCGFSGL